jgi:hypothetical protein
LPKDWPSIRINYRYRQTIYRITIDRAADSSQPSTQIVADGRLLTGDNLPLVDDQAEHNVEVKYRDGGEIASRPSQVAVNASTPVHDLVGTANGIIRSRA